MGLLGSLVSALGIDTVRSNHELLHGGLAGGVFHLVPDEVGEGHLLATLGHVLMVHGVRADEVLLANAGLEAVGVAGGVVEVGVEAVLGSLVTCSHIDRLTPSRGVGHVPVLSVLRSNR